MKVIYEFYPDDGDNNDKHELSLIQKASHMYNALYDLDNIRRNLYKGYKYYDQNDEEEDKQYSRIDVDLLLRDISEVLVDSNYTDPE